MFNAHNSSPTVANCTAAAYALYQTHINEVIITNSIYAQEKYMKTGWPEFFKKFKNHWRYELINLSSKLNAFP